MKLLQPLLCLFGKHHRSRREAWDDGRVLRSTCEGCGRPMIRTFDGWKLDPDPIDRPPPDRH